MTVIYPPKVKTATFVLYSGTAKDVGSLTDAIHAEGYTLCDFILSINSITVGASPSFVIEPYVSVDGTNFCTPSTNMAVSRSTVGLANASMGIVRTAASGVPINQLHKYLVFGIKTSTDITAVDWALTITLK